MSYIALTVDRESLGAWIGKLSGEEARSRKHGQIKVIEIVAVLWPGGLAKGLPVVQRNRMIRDKAKELYGIETLDPKTINAAFRQSGNS